MTHPLPGEHIVASEGGAATDITAPKPPLTSDMNSLRDAQGDTGYDRLIEFTIMVSAAR